MLFRSPSARLPMLPRVPLRRFPGHSVSLAIAHLFLPRLFSHGVTLAWPTHWNPVPPIPSAFCPVLDCPCCPGCPCADFLAILFPWPWRMLSSPGCTDHGATLAWPIHWDIWCRRSPRHHAWCPVLSFSLPPMLHLWDLFSLVPIPGVPPRSLVVIPGPVTYHGGIVTIANCGFRRIQ